MIGRSVRRICRIKRLKAIVLVIHNLRGAPPFRVDKERAEGFTRGLRLAPHTIIE